MIFYTLHLFFMGFAALHPRQKLMELSDEDLMFKYVRGEKRAFEELYRRHRQPIFNFILRYVKSTDQAEELMQEVFAKVVQNAHRYTKQAKFTTWLYTIARNLCIDLYRRQKNRKTLSLQQNVGRKKDEEGRRLEELLEGEFWQGDGEQRLFSLEVRSLIERGVAALPEKQREVFLLREVSHLSYKEIADIVGTLENTVKSRMRYALEFLRKYIEKTGLPKKDLET